MSDGAALVRPATPADLAGVARVDHEVYGAEVYPAFFFRQALDLWPDGLRVADAGGAVVGYVLSAPSAREGEAWVLSLAVSADARGRGVGGALMLGALEALARGGAREVYLTASPANTGAVGLYHRLGFTTERASPDHFGPGETRLLLRYDVPGATSP